MNRFLKRTKVREDIFRKTILYGIIAATPETDTLSVAITLAGYFRSVKGYRSALVSAWDDASLKSMLKTAECIDVEPSGYDDGVLKYYILNDLSELKLLRNKGYDSIVIDLGADYGRYIPDELLQIDCIKALVSTHPWRYQTARELLFSTIIREKELRQRLGNNVFSLSGTEQSNHRLSEEFHINVTDVSAFRMIPDPYRINKASFQLVEKFI